MYLHLCMGNLSLDLFASFICFLFCVCEWPPALCMSSTVEICYFMLTSLSNQAYLCLFSIQDTEVKKLYFENQLFTSVASSFPGQAAESHKGGKPYVFKKIFILYKLLTWYHFKARTVPVFYRHGEYHISCCSLISQTRKAIALTCAKLTS